MSSIDSSTNVDLGTFMLSEDRGVPIYWPLSLYEHESFDMTANGSTICLGGGSGEHPCLMLDMADILFWLLTQIEWKHDSLCDLYMDNRENDPTTFQLLSDCRSNFSETVDRFNLRNEPIIHGMWSLPIWTRISNNLLSTMDIFPAQGSLEFADFMTVASFVLLQAIPWDYTQNTAMSKLATKIKKHIENPETSVKVARIRFLAKEFYDKCAKLLNNPSLQGTAGKCIVRADSNNPAWTGNYKVQWGFGVSHLEQFYLMYSAHPGDLRVPRDVEPYLKAKVLNSEY